MVTAPVVSDDPATQTRVAGVRGLWSAYMALAKAKLANLVVVTAGVGFVLADYHGFTIGRFALAMLGTMLAAWGANALNQVWEAGRDATMRRTRTRPIPAGLLSRTHGTLFGLASGAAGVTLLALLINPLAAALGALTILLYVLVYTPMKTRTSAATLVGAVVGAIPPMIGWAAAVGHLQFGAWALAGLLFVWQIPHFLALAWMYRDDYQRGGYHMLSRSDADGWLTASMALLYSLTLVPIALTTSWAGISAWPYTVGATLLGLWMAWLSWRLWRERTNRAARRLFIGSVLYLPALLLLLIVDHALQHIL